LLGGEEPDAGPCADPDIHEGDREEPERGVGVEREVALVQEHVLGVRNQCHEGDLQLIPGAEEELISFDEAAVDPQPARKRLRFGGDGRGESEDGKQSYEVLHGSPALDGGGGW